MSDDSRLVDSDGKKLFNNESHGVAAEESLARLFEVETPENLKKRVVEPFVDWIAPRLDKNSFASKGINPTKYTGERGGVHDFTGCLGLSSHSKGEVCGLCHDISLKCALRSFGSAKQSPQMTGQLNPLQLLSVKASTQDYLVWLIGHDGIVYQDQLSFKENLTQIISDQHLGQEYISYLGKRLYQERPLDMVEMQLSNLLDSSTYTVLMHDLLKPKGFTFSERFGVDLVSRNRESVDFTSKDVTFTRKIPYWNDPKPKRVWTESSTMKIAGVSIAEIQFHNGRNNAKFRFSMSGLRRSGLAQFDTIC